MQDPCQCSLLNGQVGISVFPQLWLIERKKRNVLLLASKKLNSVTHNLDWGYGCFHAVSVWKHKTKLIICKAWNKARFQNSLTLTAPYSHNSALSDTYTEASLTKLRAAEAGIGRELSTHASELYSSIKDLPFINFKTCLWDWNIWHNWGQGEFFYWPQRDRGLNQGLVWGSISIKIYLFLQGSEELHLKNLKFLLVQDTVIPI